MIRPIVLQQLGYAQDLHSNARVDACEYTSIRYTERLAEAVAEPSISVGDSYDNAMAESIIGLFQIEVVRRRGQWRGLHDVEIATLEWVDWFNNPPLRGARQRPPAEPEASYYLKQNASEALEMSEPSPE